MAKRHLVERAEFDLRPGQTLVVSIAMLGSGLDRVIVERDRRGNVRVRANNGPAGGRFEFDDRQSEPGECDFWLARTDPRASIADTLRSLFWSQFTYTEMDALRRNYSLQGKLAWAVRSLSERMESTAAKRLNRLVKLRRFRKSQRNRDAR